MAYSNSAAGGVGNPMGGDYPSSPPSRQSSSPDTNYSHSKDPPKRKKRSRVLTPIVDFSIIPGVKHTIEGYHDRMLSPDRSKDMRWLKDKKNLLKKDLAAREKITSIDLPEAGRGEDRRAAARRRMRGAFGTILTGGY